MVFECDKLYGNRRWFDFKLTGGQTGLVGNLLRGPKCEHVARHHQQQQQQQHLRVSGSSVTNQQFHVNIYPRIIF